LKATGLPTNDSDTLPLFNKITDTSFFKIGSNFPFIPQTPGSAGNLDGSGFKYHHNDDLIYSTIDRLNKRTDKTKPFFASLNFATVHDPVQELPHYIRKFWTNWPAEPTEKTCVFMNIGWDRYRDITLAAQIENGTIKNGAPLPPRSENINAWNTLTYADKVINSKSMAIIAAMIIHIDDSVGQFVKYLKDNNIFNNTMLMFMSDNGGAGNFSEFAQTFASSGGNGNWGVAKYDASSNPNGYQEGDENSFLIPGWGWASAMEYPFRMIKSYPEKGGVQTPFVLSWPNGIPSQRNGGNVEHYCWLEDIFPTMFDIVKPVQDVVDSSNATRFNLIKKRVIYNTSEVAPAPTGNPYVNYVATLPPIKGTSLLPFIRGDSPSVQIYRPNPEVSDLCVICGTSVTFGNWQIIRNWGLKAINESYEPYGVWRLYNTITDPYQTTDLASEYPEKYKEMKGYFIDFCRTQSVPESASADTYKIASFIGTYNNKLSTMLDTYIKDQLYLDGSGSFLLPALPPPASGWRFKGAADTSGGANGAHQYIPDGTAFVPKQTIPNALKAAPIKKGEIPVVNDGSAQGMYAGNAIANGRLSDPHYESTILLSNSGAFGVARGWDGSYNREFPSIPALTYFYDDALRIVLYANPGMLFFDSSGMSGGIGIDGTYNAFAGVTDPSSSLYDPLASTDASSVCYGRARLVYDLPYAELVDRTERGYYVGETNPYDAYNRFQFDSSGTGFSLDSSNNRVRCDASGNRSPSPSRVTKRVINLITGCSNLGGENATLSKNYHFSTSQAAASSLGFAIRFKVDSSNNLDINTSLNYGSMVDQSWGFPAVGPIPITPNNSRLTTFYGLVQPSQYPGTTTDSRIINYIEPASSIIKFKGNVNYLTYHTDRQNIPAFVTARLTVGNAVEGIWSGMYGCDYTCYFNSNVPYNAYVSAGFKLDRNSEHDYFPGDILQLPYASGVAITTPPTLAAVYRGRGVI
jgi:arylsulfatase A-like enzyme